MESISIESDFIQSLAFKFSKGQQFDVLEAYPETFRDFC